VGWWCKTWLMAAMMTWAEPSIALATGLEDDAQPGSPRPWRADHDHEREECKSVDGDRDPEHPRLDAVLVQHARIGAGRTAQQAGAGKVRVDLVPRIGEPEDAQGQCRPRQPAEGRRDGFPAAAADEPIAASTSLAAESWATCIAP
jgi:hypothetical protein